MARPLRIAFAGGVYHVTSRGNERGRIVSDDADRAKWQAMLCSAVETYGWRLFAYALMDNHYHLFIQTPEPNLSEGMHALNAGYVTYYNTRHARVGHLFQGRFRAIVVEEQGHWLELSRYVHLNPVRAGLVRRPEQWVWSSYPGYYRVSRRSTWVNYARVFAEFGGDGPSGRRRYRHFVEAGLGRTLESPLSAAVRGLVLGSDAFVARIRAMLDDRPDDAEVPDLAKLKRRPSVADVVRHVSEHFGCDASQWAPGRRCDDIARAVAAYLARSLTGESSTEIAAALGYRSTSSISRACRRVESAVERGALARDLDALRQRLTPTNH